MQRQRSSGNSRTRYSPSAAMIPQSHAAASWKGRIRFPRSAKFCSAQLIFLASLLVAILFYALFAKAPTAFSPSHFSPVREWGNSKFAQHSIQGRYVRGPSLTIRNASARVLSYNRVNFTIDGVPIRIVSGSVHYFRAVPSQWRRILRYARVMGLNAIETYIPWNLHEQVQGKFRFQGILDLRAFLEIAYDEGLFVLLRPGPYICSEWDMGGLPAYLLADNTMSLRSTHSSFMRAAFRYFDEVAEQIGPYIGKPVLGIQIENEYGAFGYEKEYLQLLLDAWKRYGFSHKRVMYFTSDNGGTKTVLNGSQFQNDEVLKTINLDRNVEEKVEMLRYIQPAAPVLITEFWAGWFDHWGESHHIRHGSIVVKNVEDALLKFGVSINLYMFFGGTNFGFMSGANIDENMRYLPDVTSYDYDGFLTEIGTPRQSKFLPMQLMLRRFWKTLDEEDAFNATYMEPPSAPLNSAYTGHILLTESIPLLAVLDIVKDHAVTSEKLMSMEAAGGDFGFVMYRHKLKQWESSENASANMQITGARDLAYVLADGEVVGKIDRNDDDMERSVIIPYNSKILEIIVENQGRVNYGQHLHDRKGIVGTVTLNSKPLQDFEIITMSFPEDHPIMRDVEGRQTISKIRGVMKGRKKQASFNSVRAPPTLFRGELLIPSRAFAASEKELPGTHCRVHGHGILWVNGFNVGRFRTDAGPQMTLFVPGALLRIGRNEILVLHMDMHLAKEPDIVKLFDSPQLGSEV